MDGRDELDDDARLLAPERGSRDARSSAATRRDQGDLDYVACGQVCPLIGREHLDQPFEPCEKAVSDS